MLSNAHAGAIVLIVDDVPENLAVLHDALDEAGYVVLVATNGKSAIERALEIAPDVILLDALMPGLDGFEVARRLKAHVMTQAIPIIFMTGLTETEHVVAAFAAGGSDYVTKPIRPPEVLARIASQVQNARHIQQTTDALDTFGQGMMAVRLGDGAVLWRTPLAKRLLDKYLDGDSGPSLASLQQWIKSVADLAVDDSGQSSFNVSRDERRLTLTLQRKTEEGDWLIALREEDDALIVQALSEGLQLTLREAEVLYWVVRGKISRDIADILGTSPRTINKHLEHVFVKLGVETRTAAAARAMNVVRLMLPPGRN
ncbi:MAG: response regulator transcription factor [Betaproteobacteria bacterium]|nr:response regulator transcription factor [Betaproteobacteria bacterium]